MKTGPCKQCTERFVGCHSECLKYIDWRQQIDIAKQTKEKESVYWSYKREKYKRKGQR